MNSFLSTQMPEIKHSCGLHQDLSVCGAVRSGWFGLLFISVALVGPITNYPFQTLFWVQLKKIRRQRP